MIEPSLPSLDDLEADEALLVHQTCRRFEAACKDWQGGVRPALEDWLADVPAAVRAVLLRELLRLELDYRRKAGERPVLADYLGRFGADEGLLRRVLSEPLGKKTVDEPRRGDQSPGIPGYDVEAELGRGGMGVVYRARRHNDGAVLALKMILRGRGASFAELARFRIEAEALACLNHPNIVKIRDVGLYAGYPFIAIDFAERGSLKQAVPRGPQRPMWAAELVRTLALAMQHAHERGMLHRDLKPANVLLMSDGLPVITDFGLVKSAKHMARFGSWIGSLSGSRKSWGASTVRSLMPRPGVRTR
jgi:serine/threonine protein kinase